MYNNTDFTNNYPQHNRISACPENDNKGKSNGEHRIRNNLGKTELWKFVKHYIIDSGF